MGVANKASSFCIPRRYTKGWPARKKKILANKPIRAHSLSVTDSVTDEVADLVTPSKNQMVTPAGMRFADRLWYGMLREFERS